ncbi:VWA domain-containing protein [Motiliproteus sp. SC1-56]|uniref:VWA domain-containing protein n=1 Tax=Motiliproteus sp. SC1-56 TaxID=2799565 RepID=UPI001A904A13|nr:VWA domain-containing protein [Motiliproteus sp. SC1-56]
MDSMLNETKALASLGGFTELASPFAGLRDLPPALAEPVIVNSIGTFEQRCKEVTAWRSELLQGKAPSVIGEWLPGTNARQLFEPIEKMGLLRYCRDNEELTDGLVIDLLRFIEQGYTSFQSRFQALLDQLHTSELERLRALNASAKSKRKKRSNTGNQQCLTAAQLRSLAEQAEAVAWGEMTAGLGDFLDQQWRERIAVWQQLEQVLGDLQLVLGLGFDFSRGVLQSHGWMNMVALRKLLKKLPQLQGVIQSLGRMREAEGAPIVETIFEPLRRTYQRQRDVRTPLAPMETRGITRTDNISRMLPQEAALLGHPLLKRLWHAKRAEHALVSYAVEGVMQETFEEEAEELQEVKRAGRQRNEERGPIIICLDTSGSMRGRPEDIAKAVVLETLIKAGQDRRGCYVYLFGSRGEVSELELSANENGIDRLISFLCMSFGGGTDVNGPLQQALDKCKETQWQDADILVVSDGEFGYPDTLIDRIKRRRNTHALKVHGVLIGSASPAMSRLCDPLHHFSKWTDLSPDWE